MTSPERACKFAGLPAPTHARDFPNASRSGLRRCNFMFKPGGHYMCGVLEK